MFRHLLTYFCSPLSRFYEGKVGTNHHESPTEIPHSQEANANYDEGPDMELATDVSTQSLRNPVACDFSLQSKLYNAAIPNKNGHDFIPLCAQDSLINEESIKEELLSCGLQIDSSGMNDTLKRIEDDARQLFGILVCIGKAKDIREFLNKDVLDADLPLRTEHDGKGKRSLSRRSGHIQAILEWEPADFARFDHAQTQMTAPKFNLGDYLELDTKRVVPLLNLKYRPDASFQILGEDSFNISGGYSEVFGARIHPSHYNFNPGYSTEYEDGLEGEGCLVAIKQLNSRSKDDFLQEKTILEKINNSCKHPHIIKLLASYRFDEKYFLIFPLASSNLEGFWKATETKPSNFEEKTVRWSLKQMVEIADVLHWIHEINLLEVVDDPQKQTTFTANSTKDEDDERKYGRHGDIKPENILYFKGPDGKDLDILKIADLGLTRLHGRSSRSQVPADSVHGTLTYQPPERMLNQAISRKYDMWSLGCLYLEFVTWLLQGNEAISNFTDKRDLKQLPQQPLSDDQFFTVILDNGKPVDAQVREAVSSWAKELHQDDKCSQVIHDFLDVVMKELLVIKPKQRTSCYDLFQKINKYYEMAIKDSDYLLKPVKWTELG